MDTNTILNMAIGVLVAWFAYSRFRPIKGLRTLRGAEFQSEVENHSDKLLIDVREPFEFKGGNIPGSSNIPLSQFRGRLGEIPKDKSIFLYCKSGMRSKSAAQILIKNGYVKLAHLQGGIGAWSGKGTK